MGGNLCNLLLEFGIPTKLVKKTIQLHIQLVMFRIQDELGHMISPSV